ncbi:MAG: hypothetical protein E7302_13895 [Butyrivibrio sp.]|nr:hypothetical protein [Butyrivibrio sp.]
MMATVARYRFGEIDYLDSDATWHTLLTIECYDETPISQHLFLPIVSMGGEDDKWIGWGATIPDSEGNYYYTSFSPAGYFLPWLCMKIFRLPVAEKSLYLFNNGLFCLSAIIFVLLLWEVYRENRYRNLLVIIGVISYVFAPELLHGMGIVYWNQSIMQVTLLLQIYAYYRYAVNKNEKARLFFYVTAFINPYIEWTGYVANVGFAIAEIIVNYKDSKIRGLKKAIILGLITVLSFAAFCGHYLLRTDTATFFMALKNRFMARNVTTSVLLTDVIGGYLKSFLYLWVVLLALTIWAFIKKGNVEIRNGILLFVSSFPVLENIIMKEHALSYTYDRMKGAFVLILILCEIVRNILETYNTKKSAVIIVGVFIASAWLNITSYMNNPAYIWEVDYRNSNSQVAEYVVTKYPDAIYASDTAIRGYMNLLFGRGIYEWQSFDSATEIASQKEKQTVVFINKDGYKLQQVYVKDISSGMITEISIQDGMITEVLME